MTASSEHSDAVPRHELVDLILNHIGPVMILGGSGSGKTTLARELADRAEGRRIVDNAEATDAQDLSDHPILLARSQLIDPIGPKTLVVDESRLWFSLQEIEEVLLALAGPHPATPALAAAIHARTGGWPAAVAAAGHLLNHRPQLRRRIESVISGGPHLAEVISRGLADAPGEMQDDLGQLARFPLIVPDAIKKSSSCESWQAIRAAGVPFQFTPDGLVLLPQPIARHLSSLAPLRTEMATTNGILLAEILGLCPAIKVLIEVEAWESAQEVFLATPTPERYGDDDNELLAYLRLLADKVDPEPELLLGIAALTLRLAQLEASGRDLSRCYERAMSQGDAITALRARILTIEHEALTAPGTVDDTTLDELGNEHKEVGNEVTAQELKELRFRVLAHRQEVRSLVEALRVGEESAAGRAAMGDEKGGAELLRKMAVGPLLTLGRYQQMATMDRRANEMANELVPSERSLVFRAMALALAGDLGGHNKAIDQLYELYGEPSTSWLQAYIWGARMVAAAFSRRPEGVTHAFERYEQAIGELATTQTGVHWTSIAAECHALVGRLDTANQLLERVKPQRHQLPAAVGMAGLIVYARSGWLSEARAEYNTMLDEQVLAVERQWRAQLELLAAERTSPEETERQLEDILYLARQAGCQNLAREVIDGLFSEAPRSRGPFVQLFGQFRIVDAEETIDPPPGKPSDLVKMLVLRGGQVHVEQAIDAMWPDVDLAAGRRRMKNVLGRARALLGHDGMARNGDLIVLSDSVDSDLLDFRRCVAGARAAAPRSSEFVDSARQAIVVAGADLLPADRFADWLADDRWQIESVVSGLLQELASCYSEASDLEWLLSVTEGLEYVDRSIYLQIADTAESNNLDSVTTLARRLASLPP